MKVSLTVDEDAALTRLGPSIETDVRATLQERAEVKAIRVFAENLRHLLLQPPARRKRVLAIDPGFLTGCKVVALDEQGDLVEETGIYPHEPHKRATEATQAPFRRCHETSVRSPRVAPGDATPR